MLAREVTDRGDIVARAAELGTDLERGGRRAHRSRRAARGADGRLAGPGPDARAAGAALARARARSPGSASDGERGRGRGDRPGRGRRRSSRAPPPALARELAASLPGFHLTIGRSRRAADPVDLYRAGKEALLAVNVAEADGLALLAFEDTGAYRLLLPAMSEDPGELERFYDGDGRAARPPTTSSTRPSW